jgi:hypothetical protein
MADFSKGYIYELVNDMNNDVYVGSSLQSESVRFSNHVAKSRDLTWTSLLYRTMRAIGAEHFSLIVLERFPCSSWNELREREEHWKVERNAQLNQRMSASERRKQEKEVSKRYYVKNREVISEQRRLYYVKNREVILEKVKQHGQQSIASKAHYCQICECSFPTPSRLRRHFASLIHKSRIKVKISF